MVLAVATRSSPSSRNAAKRHRSSAVDHSSPAGAINPVPSAGSSCMTSAHGCTAKPRECGECGDAWTYPGRLQLVTRNRHWRVAWSPAAIYPRLRPGMRFVLGAVWPARAAVLASDGTDLSSPSVIAQSGSIALLTGTVVSATKAQAKALGAPYQAGDLIGQGGIEQAYQAQLAGRPSLAIQQ